MKIQILILTLFLVAAGVSVAQEAGVVTLDPSATFQTFTGWEATAQAAQEDSPLFDLYKDELFDQAVDLGINRVRLEIRSGVENDVDYWQLYRDGQIPYEEWRGFRYSTENDNNNPALLNMSGFHFSGFDHTIESVVLPMKERVEARGEKFYINVCYVAFTSQIDELGNYIHHSPQEYGEFVLATCLHLRDKYGIAPDRWEVILEPDNFVQQWNGTLIGRAIIEAAKRLEARDLAVPGFIAPSCTHILNGRSYFNDMMKVLDVSKYLREYAYHRYGGAIDDWLRLVVDEAQQWGVQTAHLEWIGAGYEELHQDLKVGNNSAWSQYTLAWLQSQGEDDGGKYFLIDDSDANAPKVVLSRRAGFLRQYMKYIRSGAVRIGADGSSDAVDPVAFINTDGKYVVVLKSTGGGETVIQPLPAGTYGTSYTTTQEVGVSLPDITIGADGVLRITVPPDGVLTVYQKDIKTGVDGFVNF